MISVKDLTPNDIIGVLEEVAGLGYEGVEFARGFFLVRMCQPLLCRNLQGLFFGIMIIHCPVEEILNFL